MTTKTRFLFIGGLALAILVVLVAWRIISGSETGRDRPQDQPLTVNTATVLRQTMPIQLQAVGQVQSEHSVQIRPQVSGVLKQVFFTEGQQVKKGQRLFQIDPAPYVAVLTSAKSAWESAKANADRMAPLAAKEYITPQELADARTAADQAQAAYQQAQINLGYTDIRAPITGRTGAIAVRSGNVVGPSDSAPLVTINQMQPILVQFNLAQHFLPQVRKYQQARTIRVFVTREDGSGDLGEGKLVFMDNTINPGTGTVMLKAEIPNHKVQLWPGQYVGITVQLARQSNALVVPSTAVQFSENGNFVYVVENDTAVVRPVTVDRQVGDLVVIGKGLDAGEKVITHVSRNLRPGVKIRLAETPPAAGSRTMDTAATTP
ncbi:MAG TPA: efflux RND transporter periplasmic adaptor subunit [Gammaproteobacteria bacterium]|nr:efflux RND transporter periplasmic adaptor subunit [Gammaproteobacteria bacterium]